MKLNKAAKKVYNNSYGTLEYVEENSFARVKEALIDVMRQMLDLDSANLSYTPELPTLIINALSLAHKLDMDLDTIIPDESEDWS